jgi:pimeloyl-ACP methyl ester carboxylesterase
MKNYIVFLLLGWSFNLYAQEKIKTDTFNFVFEGKKLNGLVDLPLGKEPTTIVVLVPGSGKTDIVAGNGFSGLRKQFIAQGLACLIWDKAGCGKSEGVFEYNQTVQNSAAEVVAAIKELKSQHIPGFGKVGLWGISRAGWICPLVIEQYPSIAFWISVSGTDDRDNYGYLLKKNFIIEGRTKAEADKLVAEWQNGNDIARNGGSFEENQKATQNIRRDPFYIFMAGNSSPTSEGYLKWQKKFQTGENVVDAKSGLLIYVPDFEMVLKKIHCPVLAIFGEKDSQVDWQKTMALYKKSLGKNHPAQLTIKTIPNGNHNMQKCKTGGYREKLLVRQPAIGYYETMQKWIRENGFSI